MPLLAAGAVGAVLPRAPVRARILTLQGIGQQRADPLCDHRGTVTETADFPGFGLGRIGKRLQFVMAYGQRGQVDSKGLDDAAIIIALAMTAAGGAVHIGDQAGTEQVPQVVAYKRRHTSGQSRDNGGEPAGYRAGKTGCPGANDACEHAAQAVIGAG